MSLRVHYAPAICWSWANNGLIWAAWRTREVYLINGGGDTGAPVSCRRVWSRGRRLGGDGEARLGKTEMQRLGGILELYQNYQNTMPIGFVRKGLVPTGQPVPNIRHARTQWRTGGIMIVALGDMTRNTRVRYFCGVLVLLVYVLSAVLLSSYSWLLLLRVPWRSLLNCQHQVSAFDWIWTPKVAVSQVIFTHAWAVIHSCSYRSQNSHFKL